MTGEALRYRYARECVFNAREASDRGGGACPWLLAVIQDLLHFKFCVHHWHQHAWDEILRLGIQVCTSGAQRTSNTSRLAAACPAAPVLRPGGPFNLAVGHRGAFSKAQWPRSAPHVCYMLSFFVGDAVFPLPGEARTPLLLSAMRTMRCAGQPDASTNGNAAGT